MEKCYFGVNIKFIRKKLRYSQEELGNMFNKTRSTVCLWEADKSFPNVSDVFQMADVFGVTVNQLLCEDLEKTNATFLLSSKNIDNKSIVAEEIAKLPQESQEMMKIIIDFLRKEMEKK